MAFNHADVVAAQLQALTCERSEAVASYEAARNAESSEDVMYASDRILTADAKLAALNQIANNLAAQQPKRVEQMAAAWQKWANRANVLPWEKVHAAPRTPAPIPQG